MPLDVRRPFTRRDALAAGITAKQLRGTRYRTLLAGVHISAAVPLTPTVLARAALVTQLPCAVVTHHSAARILGAPVPASHVQHVTVPTRDERRRRQGVRCHVAALGAAERMVMHGVQITAPRRLFVEMAEYLSLVELVVLGDWLVRQQHVTCASLVEYCRSTSDRHVVAARRAASYVRERVDSPMETRLRMLLVLAGLPEPEVNRVVRDDHGNVLLRLDLSYPAVKVAVEYDGRQHTELVEQRHRDLERRDDLDDGDWRLVVVTSKGVFVEPEVTLQRVWRALRARGWRNLPPPGDGWRAHFPH
jgi:very-short-patch-repair endonuclease